MEPPSPFGPWTASVWTRRLDSLGIRYQMKLVLASASPARLITLRRAGLDPEVVISNVAEDEVATSNPIHYANALAQMKCRTVAQDQGDDALVIGCDSVLAFKGAILGKPANAAEAISRWRRMRGESGVLVTGHCVSYRGQEVVEAAETIVHFADISDAEIETYVATGEPLVVAGAFTIDGKGGPFISGIEGDPHNVVGISLPLLRRMFADVGVNWTDLWS